MSAPTEFPHAPVRLWLQSLSDHERAVAMVIYAERVIAAGNDDEIAALEPLIDEAERLLLDVISAGRAPLQLPAVQRLLAAIDALQSASWGIA